MLNFGVKLEEMVEKRGGLVRKMGLACFGSLMFTPYLSMTLWDFTQERNNFSGTAFDKCKFFH